MVEVRFNKDTESVAETGEVPIDDAYAEYC